MNSRPAHDCSGRYSGIATLRGAAAICVIAFHAACALGPVFVYEDWHWDLNYYDPARSVLQLLLSWPTAPTLFFLISGFLVHSGLRDIPSSQVPWKLLRRAIRLYLPYVVVLMFFALVFPPTRLDLRTPGGLADLLIHLALFTNFRDEWIGSMNPSFWYVASEVQFCLIYPLLIWSAHRFGWKRTIAVAGAVELVVRLGRGAAVYSGVGTDAPLDGPLMHTPLAFCFTWAAGAWLGELYHTGRLRRDMAWKFMPWALLGIAALMCTYTAPLRSTCMALFYVGVLVLALCPHPASAASASGWTNRFDRHLKFAGSCGYILYLTNQPLLDAMGHRLGALLQPSAFMVLCVAGVTYALLLPAAWIFHVVVEQRCTRAAFRLIALLNPAARTQVTVSDGPGSYRRNAQPLR